MPIGVDLGVGVGEGVEAIATKLPNNLYFPLKYFVISFLEIIHECAA